MEELDAPAEFFYNEATQVLYFWHNASAGTPPPSDGSLKVTQTKGLINMTGTMAAPVMDVSIIGVGFRDTAYTYMVSEGEGVGDLCVEPMSSHLRVSSY